MVQLWENGFVALDISSLDMEWKRIIDHVGEKHKRVMICLGTREDVTLYKEAAVKYVNEVVCHLKDVLGLPVDAHTPSVPPWS
jgi:hypothetical protein